MSNTFGQCPVLCVLVLVGKAGVRGGGVGAHPHVLVLGVQAYRVCYRGVKGDGAAKGVGYTVVLVGVVVAELVQLTGARLCIQKMFGANVCEVFFNYLPQTPHKLYAKFQNPLTFKFHNCFELH